MRILAASVALSAVLAACGPKAREHTVVVLARSPARMSTTLLDDGTVVLDANVQVFEVTNDDSLALVGELSSYEAFLPAQEDPSAPVRITPRSLSGTRARLDARGNSLSFAFDGTRWEKKTLPPPPYDPWAAPQFVDSLALVHRIEEPSGLELPKEFSARAFIEASDGTVIGYGVERGAGSGAPLTVIVQGRTATIVRFDPQANGRWSCHPVPSADGKSYAACAVPDTIGKPERRVYRLEASEWKRIPLPYRGPAHAAIAIAKDGVAWIAKDDPATLLRVPLDRPAEEIAFSALKLDLEQATYEAEGVTTSKTGKLSRVISLVPRPSGRMLALVVEDNGATVLLRIGKGDLPIAKRIGSEPDQLVAIADAARETERWVGHCSHVFVELPDAATARVAAERASGDRTAWRAVQGKLKRRPVFGVVALAVNQSDDRDLRAFERSVTELVTELTKNPASPPTATCSLPVLDRVL